VRARGLCIVDTNVVVAGLITARADAPTARILDAMLAGTLRFVLSIELLAEYRAVLLRRGIRVRHGLNAAEVDVVLEAMARNAVVVAPGRSPREAPDAGDQHLWDLAAAVPGCTLVTGDQALRGEDAPCSVVSPAEAIPE
jgi:putative PIN family toxin of toxin-antitoxin system